MALRFTFHRVAPFIWIHSMFSEKFDVFLVEAKQFWREGENCNPIDAFMTIKSPGHSSCRLN
jgi:hypothetical protein